MKEAAMKALEKQATKIKQTANGGIKILINWYQKRNELRYQKRNFIWLTTYYTEDKRYYSRYCYKFKETVVKAESDTWDRRCKQINQNVGYSRSRQAWQTLKSPRIDRKESNLWMENYKNLSTEDLPEFIRENRAANVNDLLFPDDDIITDI